MDSFRDWLVYWENSLKKNILGWVTISPFATHFFDTCFLKAYLFIKTNFHFVILYGNTCSFTDYINKCELDTELMFQICTKKYY